MSNVVVVRAEIVDIGEYPIGGDADILVAMSPVVNTAAWSVTVDFSETRLGDVVDTLTVADGEITCGEGDAGEIIRIKMANAITAQFSGRVWMHVYRTNSANRDRLALATIMFRGPSV